MPAFIATEASTTRFLRVLTIRGQVIHLHRIQVLLIGVEIHVVKGNGPLPESAVRPRPVWCDLRESRFRISLEPVRRDRVMRQISGSDQRLQPPQNQRAMGLHDHSHSTIRRLRKNPRHRHLSTRVQVQFRLLNVDELPRRSNPRRYQHRERLRYPESNVRDADEVGLAAIWPLPWKPGNKQLNLREVVPEPSESYVFLRLPVQKDTPCVLLKQTGSDDS